MKELKLLPPNDPRVLSSIATFSDNMLKEHDYKNREEVCKDMKAAMLKYGGIGLSAIKSDYLLECFYGRSSADRRW